MAMATQTTQPMAGPAGHGLPRRPPASPTTKANNAPTLILLGCSDALWLLLVPTAPPAKEQEPPDITWTVVVHCGNRVNTTPPEICTAHQPTPHSSASSSHGRQADCDACNNTMSATASAKTTRATSANQHQACAGRAHQYATIKLRDCHPT